MPKFYGKSVGLMKDQAGTKKQGGGKANWGREGDELEDMNEYRPTKPRRRTNSFSTTAPASGALKTKWEAIDPEAIDFDEELHGPLMDDHHQNELEKMSSASSAGTMGSVEEEDEAAPGMMEKK